MTQFRTITIPAYAHAGLKAAAMAAGLSMSELLAELVVERCLKDGLSTPVSPSECRVTATGDRVVMFVLRNEVVKLDNTKAHEFLAALLAATQKGEKVRRTSLHVDGATLVQLAPRGRGVVLSVNGEELAVTMPVARLLIADLKAAMGLPQGHDGNA